MKRFGGPYRVGSSVGVGEKSCLCEIAEIKGFLVLDMKFDSITFAFWSKSSMDVEPRRIRLLSNRYTTNTLLDTAATIQILKPRTFLATFYPKPMMSATSAAAWDRLKKHYASRSHTPIMSLKESLDSITKLIIGLKGLGPAFHEFSASIQECDSPLFAKLFHKLVDRDFSPTRGMLAIVHS
ncbi:hypothetical protein JHK87_033656 [Glycine soja]|nr:hypothetical protein JHK87_033656 [Glycine soja]KAG4986101.1 hypothetical protein JHK86_033792 [Glycine max]